MESWREAARPNPRRFLGHAFLITLVLGFAGMVVVQRVVDEHLLVMVCPLAAMGLYWLGTFWLDRNAVSTTQFADSIYYLGFLFTLLALLLALWGFDVSVEEGSLERVLGTFGAALSTTVVGLIARTVLVHFKFDLEDEARLAQDALAKESDRFRRQLEISREGLVRQGTLVEESIAVGIEKLEKAVSDGAGGIGGAASKVIDDLGKWSLRFEESLEAGSTGIKAVTRELELFAGRVAGMEAPVDVLVRRLEPTLGLVSESLEAYSKRLKAAEGKWSGVEAGFDGTLRVLEGIADGVEGLSSAVSAVENAVGAVKAPAPALEELGKSAGATGQRLGELGERLTRLESLLEAFVGRLEGHVAAAEGLQRELQSTVAEAGVALREVNRSLIGSAEFIRKELGP